MLNGIMKLINPENKQIEKLSKDEMLELLIKLNKCLRGLDDSENVLVENMTAGDLASPTQEVQNKILVYLTENLSKVPNKKARAAMLYYTLLNLHMFSDGNGRTSRFMYDLISGDLDEENIQYYFHTDSNNVKEQKNDLERAKGISDITAINRIPDVLWKNKLDFIPEDISKKYDVITVGYSVSSPNTDSIIPKTVLEQLSEKEIDDLDNILHDGFGVELSPSGLAMLYVCNKKGQLSKWLEKNDILISEVGMDLARSMGIDRRLNFGIYKNPEMVANWDVEDFREIINVGNAIKYARLKCIIDVFVEPEKYINIDTGNTYFSDIIGDSKNKRNSEFVR